MVRSLLRGEQIIDADVLSEMEHDQEPHYFNNLVDVTTYSGNPGKYVVVNDNGTGLEYSSALSNYSVQFTNDTGLNLVVGDLVSGYDDGGYILSESVGNGDPDSGFPSNGYLTAAKYVVVTDTDNGNSGYCTDFSYITSSGHGYGLGPLYLGSNAKLTQSPSEDYLSQLVGFVDTVDTFQIRLNNSRALEPVGGGCIVVADYGGDNASPVRLPYTKSGKVLTLYNHLTSGGTNRGVKWDDPQANLIVVNDSTDVVASGIVYGDLVYKEATISLQDNMETPGNWSPLYGTVALNSSVYLEGSGSLELNKTSTSANYIQAHKTGLTEDLTNKVIYIYVYIKNQTILNKLQSIQFYAGTGSPGTNMWMWSKHALENELSVGWNTLGPLDPTNSNSQELDPWRLNKPGTPVLTNVNFYTIRFATINFSDLTSSGDILWDYLHFKTANVWKKCSSSHRRPEGVYSNITPDDDGIVYLSGKVPHYYGMIPNTDYYVDTNGVKTMDVTSLRLGRTDEAESFYLNIEDVSNTLLKLVDTPTSYDTGKYLQSTSSGTEWVNIEGSDSQWVVKTVDYTALNKDRIIVDTTSSGVYTITLPFGPVYGDRVCVFDAGGNCGTVNVTIDRNGENICGVAQDLSVDSDNASFELVFYNTARGWVIYE